MRPFTLAGEDAIRITSFNSATGVRLVAAGHFATPDGDVRPFVFDHTPNTDRSAATNTFPLGAGTVLNCVLFAGAGAPRRGQCFAIVEIVRGLGSAQTALGLLVQGYVTDTQRRGWPGDNIEFSTSGPGVLRSITGTNPAAGAEISETVPTNARWRVLAVYADLVTGAAVANREGALVLDDGVSQIARVPSGVSHTASLTRGYNWHHYAERYAVVNDRVFTPPIPDLLLPGGGRVRTVTTNLQAADDWTAPQLLVEEWIED